MKLVVFVANAWIAAACGARTSASTRVAGNGDPGVDGGEAGARACNPLPNPFPISSCTPAAQRQCQEWAQSLTTTGYGRATCSLGLAQTHCTMGDTNCSHDQTGVMNCLCDIRICFGHEVCVSDTPTGPSRCRPVCVPACDPRPCTEPGERCWCLGDQDICPNDRVCVYKENISPLTCQPRCPKN